MTKNLRTIIALSLIPQIIIIKWLGKHPNWVEDYYSNGFYRFLSAGFRYVFGWIPFSVGDIFYTILGILIVRFFIQKGPLFFKRTRHFFREMFVGISIFYFVFHLFWGMNYYRLPIHEKLGLDNEYSTEELLDFTDRLILKCNALHNEIVENDSLPVQIPYNKSTIYRMTSEGYKNLEKKIPDFAYHPRSIKTSLYSTALTYMGYSGYLNPFTNEAQVNGLQIDFKYPTVSCHEEAHQIGYSAENEANFVGYLAAVHNEDIYFQYSGHIYILRYCLGEIKRRDEEIFEEYNKKLNYGIIENYLEVARFWQRHKNSAEPVFKSTFNTYLKANNQKEGIKSYNYVVALLVNYYKDRKI
ncbi:DUF3810 domain-containing protein [Robertkochia solimangrovi]|uniref:DUF3810 domain-containing protein n=1 Tax=Robertkochia solimangrovi TaxID=2213046 RepID=UPI001180289D|nr:DUF3810 domain-containing protein [Robertkochia solimangrovi]TRZ43602.1 DUF3810 domain-containing protein [Robertkochia solimangrovi]